jgi:hypothetical protein
LVILILSPFVWIFEAPAASRTSAVLPSVAGRVTYFGYPAADMYICLDSGHAHCALGWIHHDGSFHIDEVNSNRPGTLPGQYRAHISSQANGPSLPVRYQDARTSGLVMDVESDWNYFDIDLP